MVRPGRRESESAIDTSGSLPMSSAEMVSTIEVASFFFSTALAVPRTFSVREGGAAFRYTLPGRSLATFTWPP